MIFYGAGSRRIGVSEALADITDAINEALSRPLPVERHAAWVAALVAAGGLAQGLADAAAGAPDREPVQEGAAAAAMLLTCALALVMGRSWSSDFADLPTTAPRDVADALASLTSLDMPDTVDIRLTEGFAHYALYPEAYWVAAAALPLPQPTEVIGIRSIGTTLAAVVVAALDAPCPATVRPNGHPFARQVTFGAALDGAVRRRAGAVWAIADEGPGLSGSSFGAVADALVSCGVPPERIVLFASHGNAPGAMASDAHRRLWSEARRPFATFEDVLLGGAPAARGLAGWVADITGPLLTRPDDLAGGAWRRHHFPLEEAWPAVDRQNERRKYLMHGANGRFLLKFAGLGRFGSDKHARAQALAEAGFGLPPLGFRHGFIVEAWRDDLRPLDWPTADRTAVLDHLARYLGFRARTFPAPRHQGASLATLFDMARVNAAEGLGEAIARHMGGWAGRLDDLGRALQPVAIDGHLQPCEWLADGGGGLVKTDALDHCAGHDLVGCQDIAWDVAGAAIEFALDPEETEALRMATARHGGVACDAGLVAFFRIAYAAFTLGTLTLARERESGAEADRLTRAVGRRAAALRGAIGSDGRHGRHRGHGFR